MNHKKINDLAFDLMYDEPLTRKQWRKVYRIYWLSDTANLELDENQLLVINWLSAHCEEEQGHYPIQAIFHLWDCIKSRCVDDMVVDALRRLTQKQQYIVLEVFAALESKQEESQ